MKYIIDGEILQMLVQYLSTRPIQEIAPILAAISNTMSDTDKQDIINDLKSDGTIPDEEETH